MASGVNPPPMKILMLHGYAQSGPTFYAKTRAFQKSLLRAFLPTQSVSFSYPTGPHRLIPAEHPSFGHEKPEGEGADTYGWWNRTSDVPIIYTGIPAGLERVAETIRAEGPFDGVIGFSQGGALAAMVASALEGNPARLLPSEYRLSDEVDGICRAVCPNGLVQPPLKFAIIYSGFLAIDSTCTIFFEPKIKTPSLHFLGQLDSVVDESRSRRLIEACISPEVVVHVGGHFVPSQRVNMNALAAFIRICMEKDFENDGESGKK
ncbi:hypothetical protein MMC31_003026 [Peltigera leucophlebia]|nr:hypothetical protein [Peltigera leucophlebia]